MLLLEWYLSRHWNPACSKARKSALLVFCRWIKSCFLLRWILRWFHDRYADIKWEEAVRYGNSHSVLLFTLFWPFSVPSFYSTLISFLLKGQWPLPDKCWEILPHRIWRYELLLWFFISLVCVLSHLLSFLGDWAQKWFQSTLCRDEVWDEPSRIWISPLCLFSNLVVGGNSTLDRSGSFPCAFRLMMSNYNSSYNNQERVKTSNFMLFD